MPRIRNRLQAEAVLAELRRREEATERVLFDKRAVKLSAGDEEWFRQRCMPHAKQYEFVMDPSKRLALKCPRRTGKTMALMFKALRVGKLYPGSMIAYLVPSSRHHAQRLFWDPLEKLNVQFKIGLDFKVAEARVITREGTSIFVFGAKNKESPRVLRGSAWSLGVLDECKDFGPHFEELMIEALAPGLEDYDGQLVMAGTPGEVLAGTFYEITAPAQAPPGWAVHKWVKSDNLHFEPAKRDLATIEQNDYRPWGLTAQSPKFRREQLAEWCTDENERAYVYSTHRNAWLPEADGITYRLPDGHKWQYVLGLDLGERDANAFVVGAFSLTCPHLYIVHEYAKPYMSIDEIAGHVNKLVTEFGEFATLVADTGGYGRGVVTDLQLRHNLPFERADKSGNKLGNIELMNSDFLCGRIRAKDDGLCAMEWKRLTRKHRQIDRKIIIGHSDVGDAALYMWKASKHFAAHEKTLDPIPGSVEYIYASERKAIDDAIRRRAARKDGQWWGQAPSDFPT